MNMSLPLSFTLGILISFGPPLLRAAPMELKWSELGPHVMDRKVALVLPNGTHIEGKVRAVEGDGLRLRVSKTSDRKTLAKGERLIPRESVSFVRVTEYRKMGRLLVTTGAIAAAAGIAGAKSPDIYGGPGIIIVPLVVAGGIAGSAIGGYYAGKALDKRVTEIRVVPDGRE